MALPDDAPLEIERVYLLARLPDLPAQAEALMIEQGYLPEPPAGTREAGQVYYEGRVRRTVYPDGAVKRTHTIKHGEGLVRTERERALEPAEFEALWERTGGRRIRKTRHRVQEGERTWEVDAFRGWSLVLAEVELPSEDAEAPLPDWLAPHVVREVTDDPRFRNHALATEGPPAELGPAEGP